jgi:hypothetical protein
MVREVRNMEELDKKKRSGNKNQDNE